MVLIGLYFRALWKHWWALMGCAAFTLLTIVLAWIPDPTESNAWLIKITDCLSVVFYAVASYRAWNEEHGRYEFELQRNSKPDVQGVFSSLEFDKNAEGYLFDLSVCNHGHAVTNIDSVYVTLRVDEQQHQTVRANLFPDGKTIRLERGIGQNARAMVTFANAMFVTKLSVHLVDGLGNRYCIPYQGPRPMNIAVERENQQAAIIYKASWGRGRFRERNVASELRGYLETGTEVRASIDFFGDDYVGKDKYLRVQASVDGGDTKKWYTFKQNQPVRLPSLVKEP